MAGELLIKRDIKLYMRCDSRPPCRLIYDTAAVLFLHQLRVILIPLCSSWAGTKAGRGREPRPVPRNQLSRRKGSGLGDMHASSPMLAAARERMAVNSGSDSAGAATPGGAAPPNLHPQSTLDPLSMCRMKGP